MAYDNYENLGFQVKVDGADSAVSNLDRIVERLEKIYKMQGGGGFGSKKGGGLSKAFESWSKTGEITKKVYKWNAQQGNLNVYKMARKNVQVEKELGNAYYEQERKIYLLNQAEKKRLDDKYKTELGLKKEKKQVEDTTKSWFKYLAKITSITVIARRLGRFISSAIQESANYVENLNLFAVAYGDVYQDTLKWALDIADGFGLASNEVIKFAGTFRQLSTSLGLVEDTANSVSKTVTQLGYDMSALFNTSVENAMEKLQSGLFSGNVRPLRSYGIDISQNQIDALFETNQALASLGVNARNLSQSDKVLARLIITLRDGSNAFGTMNREINTLQSQIRILQGSFSNFKLAIGDLVYEPVRKTLIVVNAFLIAITNIIRAFKPLQKEDKNNILNSVAMGAEEANEQIDELNSKLTSFDKFNVLGGQDNTTSNAITEALTAELAKQQEYYAQQVSLMDDIQNEAKELAKWLEPLIIGLGALATTLFLKKNLADSWALVLLSKESKLSIAKTAEQLGGLSKSATLLGGALKFLTSPLGIILTVVGVLYATNEEFRESINNLFNALSPLIKLLVVLVGDILSSLGRVLGALVTIIAKIATFLVKIVNVGVIAIEAFLVPFAFVTETIIKSLQTILELLASIVSFDFSNFGKNIKNIWSNWASANFVLSLPNTPSFADGGYTNANLIMTHENGKREWVGKAAGSSAIVNDTQMSDIMEIAVAKGVYNALSARSAMGGNAPTNETIVVKIGEEAVFNAVRRTARRQGRDFANV